MSETLPGLLVAGCRSCHSRYLPRPGRCPRCGSDEVGPQRISNQASVLAATEVSTPPAGFAPPHRLALLEAADGVRILALVHGALPEPGDSVAVVRDGAQYVVVDEGRARPPAAPPPPA
ncbi:MAG: hypothetical protein L3K11_06135 [Thermoplasmata archaeon]|nr:hypothetical protein [Thermoplasmata archaeon]